MYRACPIPSNQAPFDRALLKIYYPALAGGSEAERNMGLVPANPELMPCPVVIMLPGINIGPEGYAWLAHLFAARGIVTVTLALVAEEMPGYVSLTPGLSLPDLSPSAYGQRASGTAIGPILNDLESVNDRGVLARCLQLDRIVLGGHSAGGSVALLNARQDWFPGVRAAFSYGAHTGASKLLGYPDDSFFPTPSELPLLIMGGTRDGCISQSAERYGQPVGSPSERVERTFDEALESNRGDCYLAIIEGANHFSMVHPLDSSTGRAFLDLPTTRPDESIREIISELIADFVLGHAGDDQAARARLKAKLADSKGQLRRGALR